MAAPLIAQEYAGRSAEPLSGPWINDRVLCRFSFLTLRAHINRRHVREFRDAAQLVPTGRSGRLLKATLPELVEYSVNRRPKLTPDRRAI
jgi:hypothetical protein